MPLQRSLMHSFAWKGFGRAERRMLNISPIILLSDTIVVLTSQELGVRRNGCKWLTIDLDFKETRFRLN